MDALGSRFFEKNYRAIAITLFVVFGLLLLVSTNGKISLITSDIDLYNHYVVTRFPDFISEASQNIESSSGRIAYFAQTGWTPSPFYSIIFLSPIWLLGSDFMLWFVGISIGCVTIIVADSLLAKHFDFLSKTSKGLILVLLPLNFNFVVDSIGVSTMSVAAFFVISAFAVQKRGIRAVLLIAAAMTRSNFVIALVALLGASLFVPFHGRKRLLLDCVPAFLVSIVFYNLFYSTYPGGGLNYLLFASYQGLDYAVPFSGYLLGTIYGIQDSDALNFSMSVGDALQLLLRLDSLSYIFNLSILKLSVTLGFVHEKLFQTEYGFYISKVWRTLYFALIALPGMYSAIVLSVFKRVSAFEKVLYVWAIFYLVLNSILIGDPRYLMGTYLILLVSLFRLIELLRAPEETVV